MKKILLSILVSLLFVNVVYADGVSFSFKEKDDKFYLEVNVGDEVISYEEAIEKHDLAPYLELFYDDRTIYFYYGEEVSKEEYDKGKAVFDADERANESDFNKRVHNTDEFIDTVKDIYESKKIGMYVLVYTEYEYREFDLTKITDFYNNELLTDINTNMYKFDDYGIYFPLRFMPIIGTNETQIMFNNLVITDEEMKEVQEFTDYFLTLFEDSSDYEKILGVYTYLKETTKYMTDEGIEYFIDGFLSPYDAIFNKKNVCIGSATTFQYFMEELRIESYIVDRVEEKNLSEGTFVTSHTYNVVKLDDKWYVLDLVSDDEAFLIAKSGAYADDSWSIDLDVAATDYLSEHKDLSKKFKFNYDKIDKKISEIKGEEQESNWLGIVIVVVVLLVGGIGIIIYKKKNA